jgi:hypothetical protein
MKDQEFTSPQKMDMIGILRNDRESIPRFIAPSFSPEKTPKKSRDRREISPLSPPVERPIFLFRAELPLIAEQSFGLRWIGLDWIGSDWRCEGMAATRNGKKGKSALARPGGGFLR